MRWLILRRIGESSDFQMWVIHVLQMRFFKSSRMSPTAAVLNKFRQTEILGEYFIQRYVYTPPSLTAITNPLTSADLSSRSSRSKTRRNQAIEQEIPAPSSKYSLPRRY